MKKTSIRLISKLGIIGVGVLFLALSAGASIIAPYSDSFVANPFDNANYTIASNATAITMAWDEANDRMLMGSTSGAGNFYLATVVGNWGGASTSNFLLSSTMAHDNWNSQLHLTALATGGSTTFSSGYDAMLVGKNDIPDNFRISRNGVMLISGVWANAVSGSYNLSFGGTYNETGGIDLTFTVTDQNLQTQTVTFTDPSPLTGQYFGLGGRLTAAGNTMKFDDFAITEPAIADALITAPYSDSFVANPFDNTNYIIASNATAITMAWDDANDRLSMGSTDGAGNFYLATVVNNLGGGSISSFLLSSTMAHDNWNSQLHLTALASGGSTTFSLGYDAMLVSKNDSPNNFRISRDGVMLTSGTYTGATSGSYDLAFGGTYNETGGIDLTFTVTDENLNKQTVTFTDPSPLTGQYFGLGGRLTATGHTMKFDDITFTEPSTGYIAWADNWGVNIGSTTNDPDGDGLLNIYEYGLGGNPTNSADQGASSVCGTMDIGGTLYFSYIHPQLSDLNSGLSYSLEVCTNLVNGMWTNVGYTILGTNVTGGDLDMVTNYTDMVGSQKFIRLIIEED